MVYDVVMDVKFGKITSTGANLFINPSPNSSQTAKSDENFFATTSNSQKENEQPQNSPSTRINDYDSNILENNAYLDIPDEMFKLEHKMNLLESSLAKITNEIEALESLGYTIQISDLKERREKIKQELEKLNSEYSKLGLGAKISGHIASAISFTSDKKTSSFGKMKTFVAKNVLSKISKKFDTKQNMKEALEKLSNINTSVDELVKLQIPYGETVKRYEKLTAYLNKANMIHSQITRNVDDITKKKAQ